MEPAPRSPKPPALLTALAKTPPTVPNHPGLYNRVLDLKQLGKLVLHYCLIILKRISSGFGCNICNVNSFGKWTQIHSIAIGYNGLVHHFLPSTLYISTWAVLTACGKRHIHNILHRIWIYRKLFLRNLPQSPNHVGIVKPGENLEFHSPFGLLDYYKDWKTHEWFASTRYWSFQVWIATNRQLLQQKWAN